MYLRILLPARSRPTLHWQITTCHINMRPFSSCCIALLLAASASAQFPPHPEGITTKPVQGIPGASISYKETSICETSARAWAGYVNLPTSALTEIETDEPYNVSMFFWYFEARKNPRDAPTAIYLAGGPGEPGVSGALSVRIPWV